jgi:2,3-diketo-5-methylthio-1-phosphopentane phosphatase
MVKIFIDFDGTITKVDVGDELFEKFGGVICKSHVSDYRQGLISAVECFRMESEACGELKIELLDDFIAKQEIDGTINNFLQFCEENNFRCYIVSDGMDYYIERILVKNGVRKISYFSNHLELIPTDLGGTATICPTFPFTDDECDRCACCKRNIMLTHSADDDVIVYIGEGYSDRCPVRYADIVFAKDELLQYCRKEKIPHSEYNSFYDVLRKLKEKSGSGKNRLKKRRQAQLACRDVFIGG